ncbi:MAG: hypothetical protein B7Y47_10155 [Sphingomonas sp. 28-63-12]|nr:MAG: hypothetical protein B7Y47_10155 [Sphingomonas sp. 28-63-12]
MPTFDPSNPAHQAAWAAIWDLGQHELRLSKSRTVEAMIDILDVTDGDPDLEDGDEDCCAAKDDHVGIQAVYLFGAGDGYAGDPEDGEENWQEA